MEGLQPLQEEQMGRKEDDEDGKLVSYSFTEQEQQRVSGF